MVTSRLARLLPGLLVVLGLVNAFVRRWVCDDAFISFRYAQHLVRGDGLVFNVGERVEGFTNLLWTLWAAAGMAAGVDPETWAVTSGLACHAGTLIVVALLARRLADSPFPVALLAAAVCPDLAVWATSGLETSLFTFTTSLGLLLVVARRPAAAGAVLAAASLARPDGVLFAAAAFAGVVALEDGARVRRAAAFALAFLVSWAPATIARGWYYGELLPNTYYAKGAYQAWWEQGLTYVWLFASRYWPFVVGLALAPLALARDPRRRVEIALVAGAAIVYTLYIARVGGDFMFARLLTPTLPLLAVLLEVGLAAALARRAPLLVAAALAAAAGVALTPSPVSGTRFRHGIADEWDHYVNALGDWRARMRADGAILRKYFTGLPVRLAFLGEQARLVYESDVATAIECETGLTDEAIAHQPLPSPRGRIGHEKRPSVELLVGVRKAHVAFHPLFFSILELDDDLPDVPIVLDGLKGQILRWDPELLAALRARGAQFPDVPAQLDRYLAQIDQVPLDEVRRDYRRLRNFYFGSVDDPAREARFRARLDAAK